MVALARLPLSLYLTTLALLTSALPVESVQLKVLTKDDFKSTISKGVWLIEHYSPYCGHCRSFAPTWEKLVEANEASEDPGIQLAQVNCIADGDLCNENKIKGYPQMNIYRDGEYVDQYHGVREFDLLTQFIAKHAEPRGVPESTTEEDSVTRSNTLNPDGMVRSLNPANFEDALKEGPTFIKFFAPWCGHCKKLAPIWTELASHMRNQLTVAEVNCEDWGSLCKSQDVTGYPMLYFYDSAGDNVRKTEYTGGRKFEQLRQFAEMATAPAVSPLKEADFEHRVRENEVVYLFLHSKSDGAVLSELKVAAKVLLGSPSILTSTSETLRKRFSLPSSTEGSPVLLAIKDHNPNKYTSFLSLNEWQADQDKLAKWLLTNRVPTALELTQDTFQGVMNAPHHPLVVLVAVPEEDKHRSGELVREMGSQWRANNAYTKLHDKVVFTWMDANRWNSWLKSMYGIKESSLPAVVIADHQKLLYYDTDAEGHKLSLNSEKLFPAIKDVFDHKISSHHSENFIERSARVLNNSLTSLEKYVIEYPARTAFFVLVALGVFAMIVKRIIVDDLGGPSYDVKQKASNRLD